MHEASLEFGQCVGREKLIVPAEVHVRALVAGVQGNRDATLIVRCGPASGDQDRGVGLLEGIDADAVGAGVQVRESVLTIRISKRALQAGRGTLALTERDQDALDPRLALLHETVSPVSATSLRYAPLGGGRGHATLATGDGAQVVPHVTGDRSRFEWNVGRRERKGPTNAVYLDDVRPGGQPHYVQRYGVLKGRPLRCTACVRLPRSGERHLEYIVSARLLRFLDERAGIGQCAVDNGLNLYRE